jgi:gamma-glutamyltranspeptidase/glutathione hydrolase
VERLLSKAYADERRPLLDPHQALPWDRVPSYGSLAGDTVAVCAAWTPTGNAVSLIHSVYGVYGAGWWRADRSRAPEPERLLQPRPAHPNRLEPGKIPLHTLIASLAFKNEKLWQVLGCMGADGSRRSTCRPIRR